MTNERQDPDKSQAPGHSGNQGAAAESSRPSGADRQEQYQRTRDQAPSAQEGQVRATSSPEDGNNSAQGSPRDRESRIRQRAHEIWESEGRPEGLDQEHWARASRDLDREEPARQTPLVQDENSRSDRT